MAEFVNGARLGSSQARVRSTRTATCRLRRHWSSVLHWCVVVLEQKVSSLVRSAGGPVVLLLQGLV